MADRSISRANAPERAKVQLTIEQRFDFLARATYVVEHLLDSLLEMANKDDDDNLQWLVVGVVPRLQQLNFASMTATSACTLDDIEDAGIQIDQELSHG